MASVAETSLSYTPDDLQWLRAELGVAHLELDPWGSLIVAPATDPHERAIAVLHGQAVLQGLPAESVWGGLAWKVPGGSGYLNVPDLAVLAPDWERVGDYHLAPPPLLIVEVASRSTRGVDRTRKLDDYRLGGAGLYLLVETATATLVVHDFAEATVRSATGAIELVIAGITVRFDLTD